MGWRKVWRDGFALILTTAGLKALAEGLRRDDPAIVQGVTTSPPPLLAVTDWPVEAGCPVAYACWKGDGLDTVGEASEAFAMTCFECDERMGESAACRWFLNSIDDWTREDMISRLLPEVERELARRRGELVEAADAL